jgi:hypothetical protein
VERRAGDEEKPLVAAEALAAEEAAKPETEGVGDDAALADDTVFGFDSAFSPIDRGSVPALLRSLPRPTPGLSRFGRAHSTAEGRDRPSLSGGGSGTGRSARSRILSRREAVPST